MRKRALGLLLTGGLAVACVDLFHSTDFQTVCDLKPDTNGCPGAADAGAADGAESGAPALCTEDSEAAQALAKRVCAWDGACNGTTQDHGYGLCLFEALRAYDCLADPAHAPRGPRDAYWRCMRDAKTCADYRRCAGSAAGCVDAVDRCEGTTAQRCPAPGAFQQANCAAQGKVCTKGAGGDVRCTGAAGESCAGTGCFGNRVRICGGQYDVGFDCASYGAGECFTAQPSGVALCKPAGAQTCAPTTALKLEGNTISACPTGIQEVVDCGRLLLPAASDSDFTTLPTPGDLSSACRHPNVVTCAPSCTGKSFVSCFRKGGRQVVDCAAFGLGACILDGDTNEPHCLPP